MTLRAYIVSQFKRPRGLLGHLAGVIMAKRPSNIERNRWTVGLLQMEPYHNMLEIGPGPGLSLQMCGDGLAGGRIIGLDHSKVMLEQAKKRNAESIATGKVWLHEGGLERLPDLVTEFGAFDRIFSVNAAQFFPVQADAFLAIYRALVPGGLAASTFQSRSRKPTRHEALEFAEIISRYMHAAGFTGIRTEELPLKPVPAVCVIGQRDG